MANGPGVLRNTGCCMWKYARLLWAWLVKFVKMRYWNCKVCGARKELDARASRLGIEVYSLHQAAEPDWSKSPLVQQQLKLVEEAESNLFKVQDSLETLDAEYRARKRRLSECCAVEKDEEGAE